MSSSHVLQLAPGSCSPQVSAKPLPVTDIAQDAARCVRIRGRLSQSQFARAIGVSPAMVKKWENPLVKSSPSLRHLYATPGPCRERLAAELTHDGNRRAADPGRACLVATRELGEASALVLEAMADGVITDAERRRLRAEAADVVRAALELQRAVG